MFFVLLTGWSHCGQDVSCWLFPDRHRWDTEWRQSRDLGNFRSRYRLHIPVKNQLYLLANMLLQCLIVLHTNLQWSMYIVCIWPKWPKSRLYTVRLYIAASFFRTRSTKKSWFVLYWMRVLIRVILSQGEVRVECDIEYNRDFIAQNIQVIPLVDESRWCHLGILGDFFQEPKIIYVFYINRVQTIMSHSSLHIAPLRLYYSVYSGIKYHVSPFPLELYLDLSSDLGAIIHCNAKFLQTFFFLTDKNYDTDWNKQCFSPDMLMHNEYEKREHILMNISSRDPR